MGSAILFNAARMQEIENSTVVSGFVDLSGHLLLERRDGQTIDAGNVQAPNLADASDTVKGIVELATDAETITGTDTSRAVTPHSAKATLSNAFDNWGATTTSKGTVELATDAETITGTDSDRVVTPSSLASLTATDSRKGLIELATLPEVLAKTDISRGVTPAGLNQNSLIGERRVLPGSVAYSGGTVVADSDGTVRVSANGPTVISLNNIFVLGKNYIIDFVGALSASSNVSFRFRDGGTDYVGADYVFGGVYLTQTWTGAGTPQGYGIVSTSGLLSVNGGTLSHTRMCILNRQTTSTYNWQLVTQSRTGAQSTFYTAAGDTSGGATKTGITFLAGTSFQIGTEIRVWEML